MASRPQFSFEVPTSAACRQMFANHRLAFSAAEMEVQEAKARLEAQNQLAAAQAQVLWHVLRKDIMHVSGTLVYTFKLTLLISKKLE